MESRLATPFRALQIAIGLTATLAGIDKFFNILADWGGYISPAAAQLLPVSVGTFMAAVGVVEMAVGAAILAAAPRLGAYAASGWLLLVAVNLVIAGQFDVAVRDVVMSIAAFTLARALEVRQASAAPSLAGARMATLGLGLVVAFGAAPSVAAVALPPAAQHDGSEASAPAALREDMRKLWTDHVVWTRHYIIAAVGDRPDAQAAAARLMKNQEDIGTAVAAYYGAAAGERLTTLLKEHIAIAVDVIASAKAGDRTSQQAAGARWLRNGEEIADFLSKANPNWPRAVLAGMMKMHLATTTDEVVARLAGNWEADARAFDAAHEHILAMSDALSGGIVKQFPDRFANRAARGE